MRIAARWLRSCRRMSPSSGAARASNDAIVAALARSDVFLLPTGGENFGHAIFEALSCGVPVLISDQTPWRGLEALKAGWDLPLARPEAFVAALRAFAALPATARAEWREGARACARAYVEKSGAAEASARSSAARAGRGVSALRLAVVVSHPIQYYAPLWRALAREPALQTQSVFRHPHRRRQDLRRRDEDRSFPGRPISPPATPTNSCPRRRASSAPAFMSTTPASARRCRGFALSRHPARLRLEDAAARARLVQVASARARCWSATAARGRDGSCTRRVRAAAYREP